MASSETLFDLCDPQDRKLTIPKRIELLTKHIKKNNVNMFLNHLGQNLLFPALWSVDLCWFFIKLNININHQDWEGYTPIFHGLITEQYDGIEILLYNNANLLLENKEGFNPISYAFYYNFDSKIFFLTHHITFSKLQLIELMEIYSINSKDFSYFCQKIQHVIQTLNLIPSIYTSKLIPSLTTPATPQELKDNLSVEKIDFYKFLVAEKCFGPHHEETWDLLNEILFKITDPNVANICFNILKYQLQFNLSTSCNNSYYDIISLFYLRNVDSIYFEQTLKLTFSKISQDKPTYYIVGIYFLISVLYTGPDCENKIENDYISKIINLRTDNNESLLHFALHKIHRIPEFYRIVTFPIKHFDKYITFLLRFFSPDEKSTNKITPRYLASKILGNDIKEVLQNYDKFQLATCDHSKLWSLKCISAKKIRSMKNINYFGQIPRTLYNYIHKH